jgi:hypothetical protein
MIAVLLVSATCGASCTALISSVTRPSATAPRPDELDGALAGEMLLAANAGLARLDDQVTVESGATLHVDVPSRECVAVIATVDGLEEVAEVRIRLAGTREDASPPRPGFPAQRFALGNVVHVATCARVATTARIDVVRTRERESWGVPSRLRIVTLRGAPTNIRTYPRLVLSDEERAAWGEIELLEREARAVPEGSRLGRWSIGPAAAKVLTRSRSTFAAARSALGGQGLVPRLESRDVRGDPFAGAADRVVPPRAFTGGGLSRLLAVVDAGALGAPCVAIALSRPSAPSEEITIRRVELPSAVTITVPTQGSALAVDTICPARGLFLYATPAVWGTYQVTTYAIPAPLDAVAAPTRLEPIEVRADLVAARQGCEAGDAAACLARARLASRGVEEAREIGPSLERSCTLGSADGCAHLARVVLERGDAARASELVRRACEGGHAGACAHHAHALLEGTPDLPGAYAAYRAACSGGLDAGCRGARELEEYQLVSAARAP